MVFEPINSACFEQGLLPLLTSECATLLRSLTLDFYGDDANGLLHALAQGATPGLTSLDIRCGACSDEAWAALADAMGPDGTCLRQLQSLRLQFGVDVLLVELERLALALGGGHGCPGLESLTVDTIYPCEPPSAAALARALQLPHGLPRLKRLQFESMNLLDLDELVERVGPRPHVIQPIETLRIKRCRLGSGVGLRRGMEVGGLLAGLKELIIQQYRRERSDMWHEEVALDEGEKGWPMAVAEALGSGAGQQLEKIDVFACQVSVQAINRLLHALATQAACPKLQRLHVVADLLEEGLESSSLAVMLTGGAACSATLRELHLLNLSLSKAGTRELAACLRKPQAVQLEVLRLSIAGRNSHAPAVELVSAL